jgi:hypothetical protein
MPLVVGTSETNKAMLKSDQSRWWSTIIEAITATGEALFPGVIFKGKDLQTQWFIEEFRRQVPNWHFITSPNGWTNNEIGVNWLLRVFIPQMNTRRKDDSEVISSWQSLTDSAPIDKINFIKAYNQARTRGMTEDTIKNAWKTTGNCRTFEDPATWL